MSVAETPRSYGRYEVERPLGRGAIGTVYVARDTRIGRRVALKTIQIAEGQFADGTEAAEFFKRLQREAEVSGSLLHPNIVTLYEAGYENDRISYLAMELVEGETLLELMKRYRPSHVPVDIAVGITAHLLRGLSHAHAKGIIHRDIKPANVLITKEGVAKVADFGIARPERSSMTLAGSLVGTPNYMSPEQVTGVALSPRADLFSLGVVLYEMLTAVKPFAAADLTGILHNILRAEPPNISDMNPEVPRAIGDFVTRLLSKSAADRPSTDEALSAVETFLRGDFMPRTPAPAGLRPGSIAPRRAATVIAVALAVAAVPILFILSRSDHPPAVTIPTERLAEFESKRRALNAADALFEQGEYEASLRGYEEYLQKYPHSTAAEEGRDRAAAALAEQVRQPSSARSKSSKDEDISARELLGRIRRVFRR